MKYRKKPVVIDACQFKGNLVLSEFQYWLMEVDPERRCNYVGDTLEIDTLEGKMTAQIGDWVICGVKKELYPCKPDIFAATYEPVEP
jgi:hypothetical protein